MSWRPFCTPERVQNFELIAPHQTGLILNGVKSAFACVANESRSLIASLLRMTPVCKND